MPESAGAADAKKAANEKLITPAIAGSVYTVKMRVPKIIGGGVAILAGTTIGTFTAAALPNGHMLSAHEIETLMRSHKTEWS